MSERNRDHRYVLLFIVAICTAVYFLLPKLFVLFGPFLLAWFFSWISQPVADFLTKKLHFPQKLAGIITVLLVVAIVGGSIATIILRIANEILALLDQIPVYYENVSDYLETVAAQMQSSFHLSDPAVGIMESFSAQATQWISETLSSMAEPITRSVILAAAHLPSAFIFFLVTCLATYFLLADKPALKAWLRDNLPQNTVNRLSGIKRELTDALGGYIKAQFILMCITFVLLLIGLTVLKVKYGLFFAIIIAILDAVPILGTGTCLIPFAAFHFISGNRVLGIGLLILYVLCLTVRQVLEPRILSVQLGLHPLITLLSMYLGLKLFGLLGMILGPPVALVVRYFYLDGAFYPLLPLSKDSNKEETP